MNYSKIRSLYIVAYTMCMILTLIALCTGVIFIVSSNNDTMLEKEINNTPITTSMYYTTTMTSTTTTTNPVEVALQQQALGLQLKQIEAQNRLANAEATKTIAEANKIAGVDTDERQRKLFGNFQISSIRCLAIRSTLSMRS